MIKSPILALFLAFIPGFGHIYYNRKVRGALYSLTFFGGSAMGVFLFFFTGIDLFVIGTLIGAALVWMINMLDMILTLILSGHRQIAPVEMHNAQENPSNERFQTILLSFIPGVGHFHLGMNQRGLTFLVGFLGLGSMVLFIAIMTSQPGFIVFLLGLPVIWIYNMFDIIQLLNRKENGEGLEDRSLMEDWDRHRESGKKNQMVATLLGIFPGAGHMYLGLQKRGLQLMVGFLLSIYILDVLRLSLFLFLIPIIWFYSFFDNMQQISAYQNGRMKDEPIIDFLMNHQKWLGIGLVGLGVFYLLDSVIVPEVSRYMYKVFEVNVDFYYYRYFQLTIVCILLIGGGVKLLSNSKKKTVNEEEK